ncbi:hypothetical protein W97_05666 [Coniosporium apollinis CBS 100218]|uniref:Uncharacterized protein n=1 Tax=Coniosporium apollinis (strain CBS 100218) TaxID=1168221 RepID=R7YWQ5_CONA1|nr:uncharacterized protein W97_05666 [Coniosporium apollinis CBS 100218]EON66273.1 hypothetical protein W97_05666 [Coniosporium apollinis CBS 100218]
MDPCGASIVSEVAWNDSFKQDDQTSAAYLNTTLSDDRANQQKHQENVNLLSVSAPDFMGYGLLQFTAQTAVLNLRWKRGASVASTETGTSIPGGCLEGEGKPDGDGSRVESKPCPFRRIGATIHSLTGELIGKLNVPLVFFGDKSERSGEFVLLSSNAEEQSSETCKKLIDGVDCGTIKHVNGCMHIRSRNVMLVEWVGDIAYRRALGQVEVDGWAKIKTQEKEIILG